MVGTLTNSRLAIKGIWLSVQLFYKLGKMHFYLKNQKHRFQGLEQELGKSRIGFC